MPLPLHVLTGAAWFWCVLVSPRLHHGLSRPRLHPAVERVHHITAARRCQSLIRITPGELDQLCNLLFVNRDARLTSQWRFTPFQRLVIALYCLANQHPLRKLSITFGWSIASLQHNFHSFIESVVQNLDDQASRECSPPLHVCRALARQLLTLLM
jgi:hypothetical protein